MESWATKVSQSGSADMLTQYALLEKLPVKLRALVSQDVLPGGYLATYLASVRESRVDDLPVFSIVAYHKRSKLDDYPHLEANGAAKARGPEIDKEEVVELMDYVTSHRIMKAERAKLLGHLIQTVDAEMPIAKEFRAFNLVFYSQQCKFRTMRDTKHYFAVAMTARFRQTERFCLGAGRVGRSVGKLQNPVDLPADLADPKHATVCFGLLVKGPVATTTS